MTSRVPALGLRIFAVLIVLFATLGFATSASAALPDWLTFWEDDEYEFNGGFYEPPAAQALGRGVALLQSRIDFLRQQPADRGRHQPFPEIERLTR